MATTEADLMRNAIVNPARRRFICVSAASAAVLLCGTASALARTHRFVWRGVALGAEAQIQLVHFDEAQAREALSECVAEIDRLENIFSLYRPDSALARLNRSGKSEEPELELVELLAAARQISKETNGAFDVTVQPLWEIYESGFPSAREANEALELVGFEEVEVSTRRIRFKRNGMSLTLNGIAQGYVTDRIAGLLKRSGFSDALVHLGETYGAGTKPNGEPWKALIEGTGETVALSSKALASSGQGGLRHLFDPRTGRPASAYESASVSAPTATVADALSTAFSVMDESDIRRVLSRRRDANATLLSGTGRTIRL